MQRYFRFLFVLKIYHLIILMYRKLILLNSLFFLIYYIINYIEFYDFNKKNILFQLVNNTKGFVVLSK
jgi:hypothetical protein